MYPEKSFTLGTKTFYLIVSENENVSEGRALELLVADGLAGYQQTNYIPENEREE